MSAVRIRPFVPEDTESVVTLWEAAGLCRPWNDPRKDIERKLRMQPELFLVGVDGERVVATAMSGYDGHRGWTYYFAVADEYRRRGIGSDLLAEIEKRLGALGCPKSNIQIRSGNERVAAFWEARGYRPDGATGLGKRLFSDE